MPTPTTDDRPFAPRGPLTREELLAYAGGRLPPERQHAVEAHLEADALARDAAEGLSLPGAAAGLHRLEQARPRLGAGRRWWWVGGAALAIGIAAVLAWPGRSEPAPSSGSNGAQPPAAALQPLQAEEILAAAEAPESLRIGHEADARHRRPPMQAQGREAIGPAEREPAPEPLAARPAAMDGAGAADAPMPRPPGARPSLQLVYLHDLKLVHPAELHPADAVLRLADAHVAARFADAEAARRAGAEAPAMAYLDFMDEALGRFARNDHKGCLDDLRLVLRQYPDDVNALFYGGLCAYNLGWHQRAVALLERAAAHRVPVFDEEAAWYLALARERLGQADAARAAFERIAAGGGFYAQRAAERLRR